MLGTANYLAPELCAFLPEVDLSSDIFSFGVTLFEMITGQLPYPAGSLDETTCAGTSTIHLPMSEVMAWPCRKCWPVSLSACFRNGRPTGPEPQP